MADYILTFDETQPRNERAIVSNQGTEGPVEPTGGGVKRKDGCFYAVNTLMILLFAVPVLVLVVLGILKVLGWIFPEQP